MASQEVKPLYSADDVRKMLITLIKTYVLHWIDPTVKGSYERVEDAIKEVSDSAYIIADDAVQLQLEAEEAEEGESTGQLIDIEALKHG